MQEIRKRLTYANVVATLALFLALAGGSAFAATQLGKNSVGAKQLKKNAVTAAKVKNGAVTPAKLNAAAKATLSGPQGPQGPQGSKGEPGSAKAWAVVSSAGAVVRSSGTVSVKRIEAGWYCINAGAFDRTNSVAIATLDFSDPKTGLDEQIATANGDEYNRCPGSQFMVVTGIGEGVDQGFVVAIL